MLPFVAYHYLLAEILLLYADSERNLGVNVNKSFNFNEHSEKLLIKANQQFGILKRTCHFVTHKNRRRVLYLAQSFSQCSLKLKLLFTLTPKSLSLSAYESRISARW